MNHNYAMYRAMYPYLPCAPELNEKENISNKLKDQGISNMLNYIIDT